MWNQDVTHQMRQYPLRFLMRGAPHHYAGGNTRELHPPKGEMRYKKGSDRRGVSEVKVKGPGSRQ
jgi:hypothetical protein